MVVVRGRMEWVGEVRGDQEIIYRSRLAKVTSRDVAVRSQKLRFYRPGDYLVEFIRADKTKEIQRIKIVRQTALNGNDPMLALFKDFRLYAFQDSFYKTIYHLELRFVPTTGPPPLKGDVGTMFDISWKIEGGRYHILDDELPYFSKIRIFQKSIILKEFKTYDITAYLNLADGRTFEKKVTIELQPEFEKDSLALSGQSGLQFNTHRPVHFAVQKELPIAGEYAWTVKAVRQIGCPEQGLEFENVENPATKGVLHYLCDNGYEEELTQDKDFLFSRQGLREVEILFKKPGEYEVDWVGFDAGGRAYSRSSKKLMLYEEHD